LGEFIHDSMKFQLFTKTFMLIDCVDVTDIRQTFYIVNTISDIFTNVAGDTILKGDHPMIISAKFGWDWLSSFRGEEFFLISSPLFSNLHNRSELFNIYYGIVYELWTFAYFDRLCKLEKRGDEIKKKSSPLKLLSQSQPNFAEMILGWPPSKFVFSNLHNRSKSAKVQSS
jgi:hypothetical protein